MITHHSIDWQLVRALVRDRLVLLRGANHRVTFVKDVDGVMRAQTVEMREHAAPLRAPFEPVSQQLRDVCAATPTLGANTERAERFVPFDFMRERVRAMYVTPIDQLARSAVRRLYLRWWRTTHTVAEPTAINSAAPSAVRSAWRVDSSRVARTAPCASRRSCSVAASASSRRATIGASRSVPMDIA